MFVQMCEVVLTTPELSAANRAIVSSFTSKENVWLRSGT
jgi:hypothetical protein